MILKLFILLVFSISFLNAGFITDLFEERESATQSTVIEERDEPIVEEEVIDASEYMNSEDEPDFVYENKDIFSSKNSVQDIQETSFGEEAEENININENENINENNLFEDNSLIVDKKSIFLSYINHKNKIYVNQHYTIDVKAIIAYDHLKEIGIKFLHTKGLNVLNPNSKWEQISDKIYKNRFYVKILSHDATLPDIKVTAISTNGYKESEILEALKIKKVSLQNSELYSKVLCSDFTLKTHHEKKYDEVSNIVVLEINATDSNLEDFSLPFALREGIDSIKNNLPNQSIYYFAIIPNDIKEFKFKYFNLNTNKFNIVSFPIKLKDSSVSTQTDLNPQKNKYILYKTIALSFLALMFLFFGFIYKKWYLLVIAIGLIIYTMMTKVIASSIVLKEGIKIHILPTKNSTIFYKTDSPTHADVVNKRDGYTKVILENKKIGWIKNDDL